MRLFQISLLALLYLPCHAQFDILSNLSYDPQVRFENNPSARDTNCFVINLPVLQNSNSFAGVSYGDVLVTEGDATKINAGAILENLNTQNHYANHTQVKLIGLTLHRKSWSIHAAYSYNFHGYATYSDDMAKFALEGNAQFIGETVDFNPGLLLQAYHSLQLGGSLSLSTFDIGARVKLLSGIEDISSIQSGPISIETGTDNYAWNFDNDWRINSSNALSINNLNDIETSFSRYNATPISENTGLGIDLGISSQLTSQLSMSASILDIGSITWRYRVNNYSSTRNDSYSGIDLIDYIDNTNDIDLTDTLYNILELEESNIKYTTSLPTRLYAQISYDISDNQRLGVSYFQMLSQDPELYAVAINYARELGRCRVYTQYTYCNTSALNIGLGAELHIGKVAIHAYSDGITGVFDPINAPWISHRIGAYIRL